MKGIYVSQYVFYEVKPKAYSDRSNNKGSRIVCFGISKVIDKANDRVEGNTEARIIEPSGRLFFTVEKKNIHTFPEGSERHKPQVR